MTMPSAKPAPVGLNENKKASKPLIEKRRRARINNSLAQLKSMVVGTVANAQTPNGKPPKLEKADILEMTVAHLRKMHHELVKTPEDDKYLAGFSYCLSEVRQYVESHVNTEAKSRVLSYLNSFSSKILCSSSNRCSPSSDLEAINMDDSSCSSNSRSETPSSFFMESSPMEYRICSPCPESQTEASSASSASASPSELRLQLENYHFVNSSRSNPSSSSKRMPADSTSNSLQQMDRNNVRHFACRPGPLNLTYHGSGRSHHDACELDYEHKKLLYSHSYNQVQSDYSNAANVNEQHILDIPDNQEPFNVPDNNEQHANGFVWRPW